MFISFSRFLLELYIILIMFNCLKTGGQGKVSGKIENFKKLCEEIRFLAADLKPITFTAAEARPADRATQLHIYFI